MQTYRPPAAKQLRTTEVVLSISLSLLYCWLPSILRFHDSIICVSRTLAVKLLCGNSTIASKRESSNNLLFHQSNFRGSQ